MSKKHPTFVFCVIGLLLCSVVNAGELETRKELSNQVRALLSGNHFSELEAMAKQYREEETRTPSGVWTLTFFYIAFGQTVSGVEKGSAEWSNQLENLDLWIEKYPASPTPYIAKSIILKSQGWRIRGPGYAKTVKPEAWDKFYKKIDESLQVLTASKKISSNDPHWYVVMADIAKIQKWEQAKFQSLEEEALDKYQSYFQIYFSMMDYYTPKWHGDAEKIEEFAVKATERTQAKEGAGMYVRIYWAAFQSQFRGNLFSRSKVRWDFMSKGIDDVLERYPDQWNINNFALFSCLARDKSKTRKLIAMIQEPPIPAGWLGNVKSYHACKEWAEQ